MLSNPSHSAPFGVQMAWTLEWSYNHYSDFNHSDMLLLRAAAIPVVWVYSDFATDLREW